MKTTTQKDASNKKNRTLRRPMVRKTDATLMARRFHQGIAGAVKEGIEKGSRELIIRIILPDASPDLPVRFLTHYAQVPEFAYYEVTECDGSGFYVCGKADTWEEACQLLESLHGTQSRGQWFQIFGLNEDGLIVEEDLLEHGVYIWS